MFISPSDVTCPKCDSKISDQTDGSVITVDIAHNGERVFEAVAKLDELIAGAKSGVTAKIRLIVGSGLIRDEINAQLSTYAFRGEILKFEQDGNNTGAVLVTIRRPY
jgi:hypothetical protein